MATFDPGAPRTDLDAGPGSWLAPGSAAVRWGGDILLAVVVAFLQVAGTAGASHRQDTGWSFSVVAVVLLLAGPVGLLVRQRLPELSLGVAFAAALAFPFTQAN